MERINALAAISEEVGCVTRTCGTPAFLEGRNLVSGWMSVAGLEVRVDQIGNLRGVLRSSNDNGSFVIASHIDTIINAGKFDGPLGVLMGLDILEELIRQKTALPFNIELIAFCDEEGCRFHTTYLGSRVVAGSFEEKELNVTDAEGVSLETMIRNNGGDPSRLKGDAIAPRDWRGYFEIHIEQGPVLYDRDIPVGIVTDIAGQHRFSIGFRGEAGHAGTVPMGTRKDALTAAAEFILCVEEYALNIQENIVATVGKLNIPNAASNVIPGQVILTLDLRSADEKLLYSSSETLREMAGTICEDRGIGLEWNLVQQSKPVACDSKMKKALGKAINQSGFEKVELVSGAGHDAVPVSLVSAVAMLFVKCYKGISHNPLEDVTLKDMADAIKVSDNFIMQMISSATAPNA